MKNRSSKALAVVLLVLVVSGSSCFVAKIVASTPCTGAGTLSAWLQFCIPAVNSTDWATDFQNTLRVIDAKFAPNSGAGGHQHNGSAGEGPPITSQGLSISGSNTNHFCLTGDGSTGFQFENCSSAILASDNTWTGLNTFSKGSISTTSTKQFFRLSGSVAGTYTDGFSFENAVLGNSTGNKEGIVFESNGSGFSVNKGLRIYAHGGSDNRQLILTDPSTLFEASISPATLSADRQFFLPNTGGILCTYGYPCNAVQEVITPDNGAGTLATNTIPAVFQGANVGVTFLVCLDTQGCQLTMSETSAISPQTMVLIASGAVGNNVLSDSSGVQELSATWTGTIHSTLSLIYDSNAWVETGRSIN